MDTLNTPPTGGDEPGMPEAHIRCPKATRRTQGQGRRGRPGERHPQLALGKIRRAPELFQPRGHKEDERHIQELARAIKSCGLLDPILVMQIGRDTYLIDGHHRLLAYERAASRHRFPSNTFRGRLKRQCSQAAGRIRKRSCR